ncbi:MAG: hypothetical protein UW22_C0069G0001, partial [Candidatus Gottesmanbacteria bacterium GW2011_GWB1_44_11c]
KSNLITLKGSQFLLFFHPHIVSGGVAIDYRTSISIPAATIVALTDLLYRDKERELHGVVSAAESLNPGDMYTHGLWQIAEATPQLKEAVAQIITDLTEKLADEHIEPTKKAFTWHTGEHL